jgi:hypothetical protein
MGKGNTFQLLYLQTRKSPAARNIRYAIYKLEPKTREETNKKRGSVYHEISLPFNSLPPTPPPGKVDSFLHFVLNIFYLKIAF